MIIKIIYVSQIIYLTQALLDLKQWITKSSTLYRFKNHITANKYQLFFLQKNVDAEEKANGNNVDSQGQIRQLTSNEIMTDYCQFTIQSLMGCYKNAGGLKKVIAFKKSICLKNITGDQSYTYLLYFLHLYYLQNLTQIK